MGATANGFAAASPGTGFPPVNGMASVLRFSDAIFEPLALRRVVNADQAGIQTSINNAMLEVAEAYLDLQEASGRVAIAREAIVNATALSDITGSYARAGQGLEADHRRALAELKHRRKDLQLSSGQLLIASANLVRVLVLNPNIVIAPVEPAETIIKLIPDDAALDDLVVQGLRQRPELAGAQEQVTAALIRWKQAKMRPFIPSLGLSTAAGGFGGGTTLSSATSVRESTSRQACSGNSKTSASAMSPSCIAGGPNMNGAPPVAQDRGSGRGRRGRRVRAPPVASLQIKESSETVTEALDSLKLNFTNIRQVRNCPERPAPSKSCSQSRPWPKLVSIILTPS